MNWKLFGKVHSFLYRSTGGRFGARMGKIDCVLLETVGRKTGRKRVIPLSCYPYRDSVVISASNSGMDSHPAWYFNLKSNPQCIAQLGRDRFNAIAEELPAEEADKLLPTIFAINPHQREYRQTTGREIPLVWLRRAP